MKTNKKLIKQLKRCGFELVDGTYDLNVSGMGLMYSASDNIFRIWSEAIGSHGTVKYYLQSPTFTQIAAAIKDHTGEELKPKPTKAQRIEALEQKVKDLQTAKENAAIQALGGVVDKLRLAIEATQKGYPSGGVAATLHEGESVLSKKQAEKITKPVFKVGDRVVPKQCTRVINVSENQYQKGDVYTVKGFTKICGEWCAICVSGKTKGIFDLKSIQHAPKEAAKVLKFGESYKLGIISEAAEEAGYKDGDTVVYLGEGLGIGIVKYMKEGCELIYTGKENLKPV